MLKFILGMKDFSLEEDITICFLNRLPNLKYLQHIEVYCNCFRKRSFEVIIFFVTA